MAGKKRTNWLGWFILLLLLGGGGWGVAVYFQKPKEPEISYRTGIISRGTVVQSVTANGQLNAVKCVQVGSQISGIIKEIKVDFNSQVKEGEIIAQIDSSTPQLNVTQAEAELANSKAGAELAAVNAKRADDLRKNELISVSEYEKAMADLHQAEAVVKMREASLKRAQVDVERTTIFAPVSGVVIARNVDVGQTVAASFNTPTLFLIANDLRKMQIDLMVSEADVGGVEVDQEVSFLVDAFMGRQFRGRVQQVRFAPTTNQNVVTYDTIIEVANNDLKLRPGMTANATIVTAKKDDALKLPNAALRFRPATSTNSPGAKTAAGVGAPAGKGGGSNAVQVAKADSNAGAGGGDRPDAEERRRRMESMTPEQREAFRQRMREGGGGGMFGGGGGASRSNRGGDASTKTVYILAKDESGKPVPKPVTIKTGISDGSFTEILEGLKENDEIIIGVNTPLTSAGARPPGPGGSPFGGPFGGGMRPR